MAEHYKGGLFAKTLISGNAKRICSVSPAAGRTSFLRTLFTPNFDNKLTFPVRLLGLNPETAGKTRSTLWTMNLSAV